MSQEGQPRHPRVNAIIEDAENAGNDTQHNAAEDNSRHSGRHSSGYRPSSRVPGRERRRRAPPRAGQEEKKTDEDE